jgi:hypothetical protein
MSHDHDHFGDALAETASGNSTTLSCSPSEAEAPYNLGLHIGAIFIIMVVSYLGTVLPLLFKKFFTVRFFGTLVGNRCTCLMLSKMLDFKSGFSMCKALWWRRDFGCGLVSHHF